MGKNEQSEDDMNRDRKTHRTVTVIGGGPAGMTAAICAARQGAGVRLIEKNNILGRKLLATGNGRCNLTNTKSPDAEETLRFFAELGLLMREEEMSAMLLISFLSWDTNRRVPS
jgi:2-polyprenyl-6-methoxyphenol hydroxylase-like FAD-dependent oxidoreductase